MEITVEIPDSLAGQLHLGAKADLRSLLQTLAEQNVSEGGLTVVQAAEMVSRAPDTIKEATRPQRNVLARLRGIYGDVPMTGENAVLAARQTERY